jgi:hypothetical protein
VNLFELPPTFAVPRERFHAPPGEMPFWETDDAGRRLRRFAQALSESGEPGAGYDWASDPERAAHLALLEVASGGWPDDGVEGDEGLLVRTLVAVWRSERSHDGLFARHAMALTRIANELRRRTLRAGHEFRW